MMGLIRRNFTFKNNVVLPLYNSFVIHRLEYAAQFWSPYHAKDIAKLEDAQRRTTKMTPSLRNKPYEEKLSHLNLFSIEKHQSKKKILEYFKILDGFTNVVRASCMR